MSTPEEGGVGGGGRQRSRSEERNKLCRGRGNRVRTECRPFRGEKREDSVPHRGEGENDRLSPPKKKKKNGMEKKSKGHPLSGRREKKC